MTVVFFVPEKPWAALPHVERTLDFICMWKVSKKSFHSIWQPCSQQIIFYEWIVVQDIVLQVFFWYWKLLCSALLEDDGNALTATDAGRADSILASSSPVGGGGAHYSKILITETSPVICCTYRLPELMNQVGSDACSWSTKWMSDGNSSTVNVGLL